jgi:DNA-binding CsgD family transcriptional regulator
VPEITGSGTGARALAAAMAWYVLCESEDRAEAMRLARFAIKDRRLARTDPGLLWVVAGMVLGLSGENTRPYWESELVEAYRTGGLFAAMSVHLWLGYLQWQFGELREAQQSMVLCVDQTTLWGNSRVGQPYADAFTLHILLDMGDLAAAGEHLERLRDLPRGGEGARFFVEAHARYALVTGDPELALELLESVQDVVAHVLNPVWRPWRSMRARVLAQLGRREEALQLVTEELVLARRWDTPALVGATLRCLGELQEPEAAVPTLREAATLLGRSPRRLEEAHALTSLSVALRTRGQGDDEEVRTCLRRALDLAEQCGADGLRSRVVGLLADVGVHVPAEPDVRSTLTVAERRMAAMAANGMPPGDIAQALFVTQHRVQSTLASVVERLGVSSLTELGPALVQLDHP